MSHAWSGVDPTQASDPGSYSLGATGVANVAITATGVRVWEGASPGVRSGRNGRLWSSAGAQLAIAPMPDTLPSGWSEYTFTTPVNLTIGQQVTVAYDTGGNYGEVNHAFDSAVASTDGAFTFTAAASAPHGNGSFTTSVGTYPTSAAGQNTFYGIDLVYTITGGNTPPVITGMSVTADGLTVTALINATDAETLAGASYRFDWGDGTNTSGASNTASHTYQTGGLYAVLGTVTDAGGLSASAARPVEVVAPDPAVTVLLIGTVIDQLASHAAALGVIDGPVNGHEPMSAPGNGLTGAVWFNSIRPARGASGLNATTVLVICTLRLYKPWLSQPTDQIDPDLVSATDLIMAAYSGDFNLGGLVRQIDLLGQFGTPLWAESAYQMIADTQYRVVSITVPVVVNDVWQQVA